MDAITKASIFFMVVKFPKAAHVAPKKKRGNQSESKRALVGRETMLLEGFWEKWIKWEVKFGIKLDEFGISSTPRVHHCLLVLVLGEMSEYASY